MALPRFDGYPGYGSAWDDPHGGGWNERYAKVERVFHIGGTGSVGQQVLVVANATATEELANTPYFRGIALDAITDGEVGIQDTTGTAFERKIASSSVKITTQASVPMLNFGNNAVTERLVHQTECTAFGNPDNNRTTIGIGEIVYVGLSGGIPLNVTWSHSGGGTISSSTALGTIYTASLSPIDGTVTALVGWKHIPFPVTFNVKAPDSVIVLDHADFPFPHEEPSPNGFLMGAKTIFTNIFGPTTVNFKNVTTREKVATLIVTWPNKTSSPINPQATTKGIKPDDCNQVFFTDTITDGEYVDSYLYPPNSLIPVDFHYDYNWSYEYQNDNGDWINFKNLTTRTSFRASDSKCQEHI